MLLVEQLRWKKNEAQTRLRSRKRKLAELYSATASAHDHDPSLPHETYLKQLQAFQDANDLQKGRLFDESTLPPRQPITRQIANQNPNPTERVLTEVQKHKLRSKSPSKVNVLLSPGSSQISTSRAESVSHGRAAPNGETFLPNGTDDAERQSRRVDKQSDVSVASIHSTAEGGTNNRGKIAEDQPSTPSKPSLEHASHPDKSGSKRKERSKVGVDETGADTRTPPMEPVADGRSRSPIVLIPPRINGEPQSSPASSNDAASSNSPRLVPASPATSPGDDDQAIRSDQQTSKATPNGEQQADDVQMSDAGKQSEMPETRTPKRETEMQKSRLAGATAETTNDAMQMSPPNTTRKPSMHIDTQTNLDDYFTKPLSGSNLVETPAPMTSTPGRRRLSVATPSGQESSKRNTRISSGVLQKKSVSEILGEVPKPASPQVESPQPNQSKDVSGSATPLTSNDRDKREKERSRLSTVVFAKPQKLPPEIDSNPTIETENPVLPKPNSPERDYLYTLFENKAHSMTRQGSMTYLIQNAHKTLSTTDHLVDYELQAECRILKRLYQLQEKQRWALRQPKRAEEAPRATSHWDFLLDHCKWMRTDFKEERKWKLAAARGLAEACSEWVASSEEVRKQLQVNIRSSKARAEPEHSEDVIMEDGPSSHPTPELMPSNEDDSISEDLPDPRDLVSTVPPAAIFSLGSSEVNFLVNKTAALEKLLNELPLYQPATIQPDLSKSNLGEKLDARWKTDIIPVSRYATEKIRIKEYSPPAKKSRYEYDLESATSSKIAPLPPKENKVALFLPENRHIRDRIHPGHSFRPPSEYPMPTQAFYETRSSSQWTRTEDDELRKLVKDYSYNWSLISSCLSPPSLYTSGAGRRTPWECFERWIGLEGLPADMSKTPYFKTYSGRIEAAGRHVAAQAEEAQRRAGPNVQIPPRKRTTQPVRVEVKRSQRHLAMLDAMRKLAKKREAALQKQQHQADLAAMRKVNEAAQPKPPFKTPAEFSKLKQEREQKMAERQEIYRQHLLAHQRATAQQQRPAAASAPNAAGAVPLPGNVPRGQPVPGPIPGMPNGNLQVPNGVPRPHPAVMAVAPGMQIPPGMMGPKRLAQVQVQMQANMARGMAAVPQQMRMIQEANKEQIMRQAQYAQAAQQMPNGNHSSPSGSHASPPSGKGIAPNPAFTATLAAKGGNVPAVPTMNGQSASPPRPSSSSHGQALSSGHVPVLTQIANKIREQYPNMPDEEVQRLASQQITSWQQQATAAAAGQAHKRAPAHNQAAINAAMGAVNPGAHPSNGAMAGVIQYSQPAMMTNEQVQQYNQRLRMQQAQQHAARGMPVPMQMPAPGPGMVPGMPNPNSPALNMARPVSQHGSQATISRSATPRDQRSGSQGLGNANPPMNMAVNAGVMPSVSPVAPVPSQTGGQQLSPRPGQPPMQS